MQSGALSAATLDRAQNAITYRVFGCERERRAAYEGQLTAYGKAAVKANIWSTVLPPIYKVISMASVVFILYFGQKNVLGTGWSTWDIAAFTTFLSCFLKLSGKSASAAKLFNSVHKAQVSWKRIRPLLAPVEGTPETAAKIQKEESGAALHLRHVTFSYPNGAPILKDISFSAKPGQIIGITGAVACGKSTLGKVFLCEYPYEGEIRLGDTELRELSEQERCETVGYLGHDPELFNDSIEHNVLLGEKKDPELYLKAVCIDAEVNEMPDKKWTLVGKWRRASLRRSGAAAGAGTDLMPSAAGDDSGRPVFCTG